MISVENLSKEFQGVDVLKDITVTINKGDVVCIIGPSGSGKSTFLRCLNMLEKPSSGRIIFNGEDLAAPKANLNLHRQKMGMVFQQFNLFPHMTVLENLTCSPMMLKNVSKEDAEAKAMELLGRVGLADRAGDYPSQLSGGQKQRVAIVDLTRAGNLVRNNTYDAVNPLMVVALTYLVMVVLLTKLLSILERRLAKSDKR